MAAIDPLKLLIKPIGPIDLDYWNKLTRKAKWDSIVALRGPDVKRSDALKFFTTAVIRYRMSHVMEAIDMRVGGMVNDQIPFVILPGDGYLKLKPTAQFDSAHFCQHVWEAAAHLQIPIAYIPIVAASSLVGVESIKDWVKEHLSVFSLSYKQFLEDWSGGDF